MKKYSDNKTWFSYFRKPWVFESIFFFMALWQESFRLSSRTSHKDLPVSIQIQKFYYYNFGDFVNGYVIAFMIDGVTNLTILKKSDSYILFGFKITKRENAFLSCLMSICIIVIFELTPSLSTTSDINDIPAGVVGAILYFIIRLLALKLAS